MILIFFVTIDSGKLDVMMLLNWKIIQYALKRGSISSNLVPILGSFALMYVKINDVKRSSEFATTAQALFPRIRDDKKNYAQSMYIVCLAMCLLQPFRSLTGPFLQAHKDFKVSCEIDALCFYFSTLSTRSHVTHLLPSSSWEMSRCLSTD